VKVENDNKKKPIKEKRAELMSMRKNSTVRTMAGEEESYNLERLELVSSLPHT
jgi:hypothetical protein